MAPSKNTRRAAKPAPVERVSLVSLSKLDLIALGQEGGQSAVDAGLEMLRRATNRQAKKQQA